MNWNTLLDQYSNLNSFHLYGTLCGAAALFSLSFPEAVVGYPKVKYVKDLPLEEQTNWPRVSIIMAARNEEKDIEDAVKSFLRQNYPNFELIVVNDRSTDNTLPILKRLQTSHPELQVVTITQLPPDILGKCNSYVEASKVATGELLLFTDGDVLLHELVLKITVNYMLRNSLDHLTISPQFLQRNPGIAISSVLAYCSTRFAIAQKPWENPNLSSSTSVAIGPYNLVKKSTYNAAGTHAAVALCVDEDMKFGKMLKFKAKAKTQVFLGGEMVKAAWADSLSELRHVTTKNIFAGSEYSVPIIVASTFALTLFDIFPYVFAPYCFSQRDPTFFKLGMVSMAAAVINTVGTGYLATFHKLPAYSGLFVPLEALEMIYLMWNSTLTTLWNNGVTWRDTHYPLKKLRDFNNNVNKSVNK